MSMAVFNQGKALAQSTVDYIEAIPAKFSNESERVFWLGYLAGEMERVVNGFRCANELQRAMERFLTANRSN